MRRLLAAALPLVALLSLAGGAGAASPAAPAAPAAAHPAASPGARPAASPTASPSPTPSGQLVEDVRARLGVDLATALVAQQHLGDALQQNAQQQQVVTDQLNATREQIAQLDAAIARRDRQIQDTQARIAWERAQLATLARAMYAQPTSLLQRVAESGNLRNALVGAADLAAAGQRAQELRDALSRDLADLQAAQELQRADRQRQATLAASEAQSLQSHQQLQAQEQTTSQALEASIAHMQAALRAANGPRGDLTDRLLRELETEQAQIVAAAEQEAWTQTALWLQANPLGTPPASAGHSTHTRFIWPMPQASISQGFGPSDLAFEPSFAGFAHFHTGIDLVEPAGSQVLAADDGVVAVSASGDTGYGNYVVVAHASGMTTLYGHLAQSLVHVGQQVKQGQPIGLEGSTGNSTGPHCHFEVRVNGQPVDPTPFLPPGGPSASRA
jgi:murein DD-endopeptidase MepM/ murein hydrolase activator NlpD